MERAFRGTTGVPPRSMSDGESLEYQFQHLSPLDAFKARGKYLHDQLKREGREEYSISEVAARDSNRSSTDTIDAFSLDYKLQSRKSNLSRAAQARPPSIRSEQVEIEEISRRPSRESYRMSTGSSMFASDLSTIRLVASGDVCSEVSQARPLAYGELGRYQSTAPTSSLEVPNTRRLHSRSTSRSQTPSEFMSSPDRASVLSSPTSSVYSMPPGQAFERNGSSESETNSRFRGNTSSVYSVPPVQAFERNGSSESETNLRSRGNTSLQYGYHSPRQREKSTEEREALAIPHSVTSRRPSGRSSPPASPDTRARSLRTPTGSPLPATDTSSRPSTAKSSKILLFEGHSQSPSSSTQRPPLRTTGTGNNPLSSRSNTRTASIRNTQVASLPDAALSAATHIELGIEQHEANQLPQSTHHFKVAADMGDPTGCLLYGLSLRHGWGVRPDLQRSIQMLQKAADTVTSASVESLRSSKLMDRSLNEDLAIAIYELGVSYKNGWGVVADKKLSLKYFELASTWGDAEAMVEAADCYLLGNGCKKDKVKAARYLRMAESKGKKEIGNSWIWKSKYDE